MMDAFFTWRWAWLVTWTTTLGAFALVVTICHLAGVTPWSDVPLERITFYLKEECEQVDRSGFFLQFSNFWSNFAYLLTGLLILFRSGTQLGGIVGAVFVCLSVGSGWFHGTLAELGQTLDIAVIYAALMVVAWYGIVEVSELDPRDPVILVAVGVTAGLGVVAAFLRNGFFLFDSDLFTPLLVVLVLGIMGYSLVFVPETRRWVPLAGPGLGFLSSGVAALLFKYTDGTTLWLSSPQCRYDPGSLLQGHALWHVLSALMFLCMIEFFRTLRGRCDSVFPWR